MYDKSYYERNKEKSALSAKKWKEKNPEKVRSYEAKWRANNREKQNQYSKGYAKRNPEKMREIRRKWKIKNPTYFRDRHVKNRYERYNKYKIDILALEQKQDGKCAICKKKTSLCVDHCHTRMIFRGLLCRECNAALGLFYDNTKFLENAIKYLQQSPPDI